MTLTNVRKTRHWCLIMLPQCSSEIHCFQHYYKVPYKGNNLFGVQHFSRFMQVILINNIIWYNYHTLHNCGLCLNRFHCCVHHHLYWFDFVIMFSCVLFIFLIWSLYLSSGLFSSFLSGIVNVNVSHTTSVTNLPLCCIYCCVDLINLRHLHLRAHLQAAYTISETLDCHELLPILPLPPTLLWSLSFSIPLSPHPAIPSAHPQHSFCGLELLWACQSPALLRSEDPRSLPPTSEIQTSSRPVDPAVPPWLLACQSTSFIGLPRPSGSALVSHRPSTASGLHSSGCVSSLLPSRSIRLLLPSSSTLVLCGSGSTMAFRIPVSASDIMVILQIQWYFS